MSEKQLVNRFDAIPPHIIKALTLCANGSTWADAAAAVGIKAPCLRRWYKDRRAEEFIETLVRENLNVANNLLTSAAPRLADELIQIALDPKVKAYARTQAISESFKILRENVLEQEQRKQLREIRETLQSIEDGASRPSMYNRAISHAKRKAQAHVKPGLYGLFSNGQSNGCNALGD